MICKCSDVKRHWLLVSGMSDEAVVYIDESGNTDLEDKTKDQRFYVSVAIVTKKGDEQTLTQMLDTISRKFNNGQPLKSSKIGHNLDRRLHLLSELKQVPFQYIALAVNKSKVDDESGLRYKKTFYKNINKRLYQMMGRGGWSHIHAYVDAYGSSDYQDQAFSYFEDKLGFFAKTQITFEREDDKNNRLVQLADIVSGSIRNWLSEGIVAAGKEEDKPKFAAIRNALCDKEISLTCWPILYSAPETIPVDSNDSECKDRDLAIRNVMLSLASELITKYESSDKIDEQRRCEVLKALIEAKVEGRNIYCDALIDVCNKGCERSIGRKAFLSEIIGGIRREGIVITGTSKGYRLATTAADINAYLHQDTTVIMPMMSKLERARSLIKSRVQFDILDNDAYKDLKVCVNALADLRVQTFASDVEIDDERVLPE